MKEVAWELSEKQYLERLARGLRTSQVDEYVEIRGEECIQGLEASCLYPLPCPIWLFLS